MRVIQIIDLRWYNACADFAIKQALALRRIGHDVLLMANPGSPPAVKAKEAGLKVGEEIDFSGIRPVFSAPRRLRKIAEQFGADIIVAHRGESHLIGALAGKEAKFRIARYRGDVRPPRGGIFSRYLNTRLTGGIAVSTERLKIEYEKKFGSKCPICRVIYPGIDQEPFKIKQSRKELRRNFNLKLDDPVVGIVGRLSPVKGHRYFIEAAKLVSMKFPRTQIVVAGEDSQIKAADLQISASLLKVPNIRFFGRINNIRELISSFDIGVVASIGSEMICRVLMEYFAAGLPVVATSVNQISELMLQSDGGILIPQADPVAMGNAIVDLLSNPDKRARLSSSAARWVATRTLETLGRESEAFLSEVLDAQ
jgi:glycosyltransferase involved in cell wall biosynthesis